MDKQLVFVDFETAYNSADYDLKHLSMVQYVRDARFKAFGAGIAFGELPPEWISGENLAAVFRAIDWKDCAVVGHNVRFDAFILQERYGVVVERYICTKAMSKAVLGKSIVGHSLADLANHFGLQAKGVMKTNGLRELTAEQEKELAEYCLHDVELCRDIYSRLAKDFPQSQYEPMHRTIDMFVNPKLVLNVPLLEKTAKEESERREKIFEKIGIPKSEFASNVKFPKLLLSRGYEVPYKTSPRTGKTIPALALGDPEFLELTETDNEELKTLCEARIAAKSTLLETRSAKLAAIGRTGRWPFDVEFSGADQTHRFSGGSGAGGNPQNFNACRDKKAHSAGHACPGRIRESVEAPEGYNLVVGDFSNIELRIVAYLSKDPGLVQAIEGGIDLYCDFASVFYGRKISKADERERRFGKTAILGLGYGMGAERFIKTVRVQTGETITEEDARRAVDLYRTRYAGVPRLWKKLDDALIALTGETRATDAAWGLPVFFVREEVVLPDGLRIRYPNFRQVKDGRYVEWVYDVYNKRNLERRKLYGGKSLENIAQALAGCLCKEAMLKMGDAVVGQAHDELICVAKKGLESVVAAKLKRAMSASPTWLQEIKLDCEVGVGKNWNEAK